MNVRRGLHGRSHGRDPGAMPGGARQVAPFRPAPVAVHNDGDVFGEPGRIEMPVKLAFLAIQSLGYFVLQSDLSKKEYHSRQQGAMTGRFYTSVARALLRATLATGKAVENKVIILTIDGSFSLVRA